MDDLESIEFGRELIEIIRKNWDPERSKREDIFSIVHKHVHHHLLAGEDNAIEEMMRCSEHYGNIVREVQ